MGKVSDLSREWDRALGVTRSISAASLQFAAQAAQLRKAEAEDAAAHAAELEAKDERIRELEAELAKRELPPLPGDIRVIVDTLRQSHITHDQAVTLTVFLDATFPKPVPQWELDARACEKAARCVAMPEKMQLLDVAARIREAYRGNSK